MSSASARSLTAALKAIAERVGAGSIDRFHRRASYGEIVRRGGQLGESVEEADSILDLAGD